MKITPNTPITLPDGRVVTAAKAKVYDCVGQVIPYVISYDTETKEVEVVLNIKKKEGEPKAHIGGFLLTETDEDGPLGKRQVATLKGVIKGSYVEVDGVRLA